MATLTPKLTLSSTDVDPNNALDLSVDDTLTTEDPSSMPSRISVAHDAPTEIIAAAISAVNFVYIKNIGTNNSTSSSFANINSAAFIAAHTTTARSASSGKVAIAVPLYATAGN